MSPTSLLDLTVMAVIALCVTNVHSTYLVSAPNTMYRGSTLDIAVDVMSTVNGQDVRFEAKLIGRVYENGTRRLRKVIGVKRNFTEGSTGILSLPIAKDFKCRECRLRIRAWRGLQIDSRMNVQLSSTTVAVLVQTDKAIYKPGQTVHFRALATYPKLQLYKGAFNVIMTDPKGNKLQNWRGLTSPDGIIESSFILGEQPVFGSWQIHVSLETMIESKTHFFTVANYDLPRFEVIVELPPYGLVRDDTLKGTVKAEYTFGQPVKGMVELHLGPNTGVNHCGVSPDTVQIGFHIDGEEEFSVPHDYVTRAVGGIRSGTQIRVTAFVKEDATGVRLNGTAVITMHHTEYSIKVLENTPNVFKPGLPYTAYFQVSSPDGMPPTPISSSLGGRVRVFTTAHYMITVDNQNMYSESQFTGTFPLPGQDLQLPASGVLAVGIDIPSNATQVTLKAHFGSISTTEQILSAYSPSNTFLQLTLHDSNVKAETNATFQIKGTEPLEDVKYRVLSRGSIVATGVIQCSGEETTNFDLYISHAMAPTGHIIVYYAKNNSEIVADSLAFLVDGLFENKVSVSFSVNSSKPAEEITLEVTADPNSTICALVVDQSVLLLKSGNDITSKKVEDSVSVFDRGDKPTDSEFALSYSSKSSDVVFRSVGLEFLSDITMYYRNPSALRNRDIMAFSSESLPMLSRPIGLSDRQRGMPSPAFQSKAPLLEVNRVRNVFPESWLWGRKVAGENGRATFETTVPDTITSWVASAFASSPETGLGVAPTTSKLRVFRLFFVSVTYPRSAVKGEKVVVQATVFNYLPIAVDVTVTLKTSDKYINLRVSRHGRETRHSGDAVYHLRVQKGKQGVAYFPIKMTTIGSAAIKVTAQTSIAADGVLRHIYVKPQGASVSYSNPIFIKMSSSNITFSEIIGLSLPPSLVEGSVKARVKVTGDLIGPSLHSISSLLSLPTGCGEQSMVKFAPDLYIYNYLKATGQLTEYYKNTIEGYLQAGIQRQLNYQRYDKGFSAFGDWDNAGSTWLTSFVARTFNQARDAIHVDSDMLMNTLNWIVDRQVVDGSFREFGTEIYRYVQGRSSTTYLTAYVLLALKQNDNLFNATLLEECLQEDLSSVMFQSRDCKFAKSMETATEYLENTLNRTDDPFTLAVTSLALTKVSSSSGAEAFAKLQTLATQSGALEYWVGNSSTPSPTPRQHGSLYLDSWRPPRVQARPLDILITSYAILTYIELGQLDDAFPAVTWLARQRNALGGFVSSQDTTMALEALSAYATSVIRSDADLNIKVTPQGSSTDLLFNVNQENALTLQIKPLGNVSSSLNVNVEATGVGMALVEFDVRFNVDKELTTSSFDVSTVLLDEDLDKFNLMVCTKWRWNRPTGMVVQEISIPSGFEPDLHSVENVASMKKAERRGDSVEVYFDEITKSSLCYSIMMTRTSRVAQTQSNYVRTYDYYSPADQSTVFYVPRSLKEATICDVCDGCCR